MPQSQNRSSFYATDVKSSFTYIDQAQETGHFDDHPKSSGLEEWVAVSSTQVAPDHFLTELLKVQCQVSGAQGGVWLQAGPQKRVNILAIHPPMPSSGRCDQWVALAAADFARHVISTGKTSIRIEPKSDTETYSQPRSIIAVPIQENGVVTASAAFVVPADEPHHLAGCRDKLEVTPFLVQNNDLKVSLENRQNDLVRICSAMDALSAFNRSNRFMSAATVLCNEMATRFKCTRVSLGFLKNRYIHVKAVSHTNEFSRKMRILQDLEAMMEECLDQDLEVVFPVQKSMEYVSRAAKQFSNEHGPVALVSLPIRHDGDVKAVMTLERSADQTFTDDDIEAARLTCDLCATRLVELEHQDRWFGARMALAIRQHMAHFLKPKYTLHKSLAVIGFSLLVFLVCAKGLYRVEAPFAFETSIQQSIAAPFDSYIKAVSCETGDHVIAGKTILGQLEISEQRLELAALKAEQSGYQKQNATAMRDRKTAEAQIAQTQIDKLTARIRLLEERLNQATLVAPISGRVISKNLQQQIGAPVEAGTVLFEIAALTALRAELYIPEEAISDISQDQTGELLAVGHPNQKIPFVVERISPIADVVNGRNVFRVKVSLLEKNQWMRPGMEGIARISIGKEPYLWLGSRRIMNWLRMKLWL